MECTAWPWERHEPFDLIFAGYALHHLPSTQKQTFFRAAALRLAPTGLLVLVDLVREPNEDRLSYLTGYCDGMATTWSALSPFAIAGIRDHIMSADYPETPDALIAMDREAGLTTATSVNHYGRHQMLLWEASS